MASARRQLAEVGAAALSLRSVAREAGLVSSAVYRYVASRDDLLTRLIIEAYDSLGDAVDASLGSDDVESDLDRWVDAAMALRRWALEHPYEYLLLYGSPVPGYMAPSDTVLPGTRVIRALVDVVNRAATHARLELPAEATSIPPELDTDLRALAALADVAGEPSTVVAVLIGWTQMFGLLSFELTNQTRGVVEQHEQLFHTCASHTGHAIGLR